MPSGRISTCPHVVDGCLYHLCTLYSTPVSTRHIRAVLEMGAHRSCTHMASVEIQYALLHALWSVDCAPAVCAAQTLMRLRGFVVGCCALRPMEQLRLILIGRFKYFGHFRVHDSSRDCVRSPGLLCRRPRQCQEVIQGTQGRS